jgi:hypothetical protein
MLLNDTAAAVVLAVTCPQLTEALASGLAVSPACCEAVRPVVAGGCACQTAEGYAGFTPLMLAAVARVAQASCGRGSLYNPCDASYGC